MGGDRVAQITGLIEQTYEAALNPGGWQSVVRTLGEVFGGASAMVVNDPINRCAQITEAPSFDPVYIKSYQDHYGSTSPWNREFLRYPPGSFLYRGLIPELRLEPTEYYNEWLRPQGLRDCIGGVLGRSGTTLSYVCIARLDRFGDFTAADYALFQMVFRNLRRALSLHAKFAHVTALELAFLDALDRAGLAAFNVDERSGLIAHNRLADEMLSRGKAVQVRHGGIVAWSPTAQDQLLRAVALACSAGQGQTVLLPQPGDNHRHMVALVMPMRAQDSDRVLPFDSTAPRYALILVKNPAQAPGPDPGLLRKLFGLTATEARLVQELATGKSLEAISEQRGVSYGTVRAQLRTVMSKTGTTRQGELIALTARQAAFKAEP